MGCFQGIIPQIGVEISDSGFAQAIEINLKLGGIPFNQGNWRGAK